MSVFRTYFFDIETRKEITESPFNGKTWMGTSGMKMVDGEFVKGTCTFIDVASYADMSCIKGEYRVTATDFPGRRVAVKIWAPGGTIDWRKLVTA